MYIHRQCLNIEIKNTDCTGTRIKNAPDWGAFRCRSGELVFQENPALLTRFRVNDRLGERETLNPGKHLERLTFL